MLYDPVMLRRRVSSMLTHDTAAPTRPHGRTDRQYAVAARMASSPATTLTRIRMGCAQRAHDALAWCL